MTTDAQELPRFTIYADGKFLMVGWDYREWHDGDLPLVVWRAVREPLGKYLGLQATTSRVDAAKLELHRVLRALVQDGVIRRDGTKWNA